MTISKSTQKVLKLLEEAERLIVLFEKEKSVERSLLDREIAVCITHLEDVAGRLQRALNRL